MKKVLIRFPDNYDEALQSLPSFDLLQHDKDIQEINVLSRLDLVSDLSRFYPQVKFYRHPDEKLSLFAAHKFAVNTQELFNIDFYFDLVGDLESASLGYFFKSEKRIGAKGQMKSWLYNTKIENPPSFKQDQILTYLKAAKFEIDGSFKKTLEFREEDEASPFVNNALKDLTELTFGFPKKEDLLKHADFLRELFDALEEKQIRFVFWDDKKANSDEVFHWYDTLNKENKYYFDFFQNHYEVLALANHTKLFATSEPWLATLACIFTVNPLVLSTKKHQASAMPFFKGQRRFLNVSEATKEITYNGESISFDSLIEILSDEFLI